MEGVNPFIKNNKHRMIMFLDELGVSHSYCFLIKVENSLQLFGDLMHFCYIRELI